MGEAVRAGLLERERDGERPRTTSSLRAEKKDCLFSIGESRKEKEREKETTPRRVRKKW